MKNKARSPQFLWSCFLTVSVILFVFFIPVFPVEWGKIAARISLTLIFIAGVLSIDRRKIYILYMALGAFMLEWISVLFKIWFLVYASKALNVFFFLLVVFILIRQIATAKVVTLKEIMESISGYLLIGIVFSIVISFIMQNDPGAYNVVPQASELQETNRSLSVSSYYGFVTMASLGYGDIVPLKPYTRSLATFICISGQLYIAILIALLVGKFASGKGVAD
jgi:voltage-gated potassium channel